MANILFLTLKTFSATGGIEKVCRIIGKALHEYGLDKSALVHIMSMHDEQIDAENNPYFPCEIFEGFEGLKTSFVLTAINKSKKFDIVLLSHINLLLVGYLIKKKSPSTKIVLLAHGIEVWNQFSFKNKKMLQCCDKIVAVSTFTRNKMIELGVANQNKISVLNNCIDPFLAASDKHKSSEKLMFRYGLQKSDIVLFTLTRLSIKDRYKGYDLILKAMVELTHYNKNIKYLLSGKYDEREKYFITSIINSLGLEDNVILTGFITDDELAEHFGIADVYVMPSTKEGFGIVFIEAMLYGIPVIAGNADGSTDALLNGKLGLLIEPNNVIAIEEGVKKVIDNINFYKPSERLLLDNFGYTTYKQKLEDILFN